MYLNKDINHRNTRNILCPGSDKLKSNEVPFHKGH